MTSQNKTVRARIAVWLLSPQLRAKSNSSFRMKLNSRIYHPLKKPSSRLQKALENRERVVPTRAKRKRMRKRFPTDQAILQVALKLIQSVSRKARPAKLSNSM
jgi:hypothetical protein